MMKTKLPLAALLLASAAGNVYLLEKGEYQQVTVEEPAPVGAVEIAAPAELTDALEQSRATDEVICTTQVDTHPLAADKSPRTFCTDGKSAGFWLPLGVVEDGKVTASGGKVYLEAARVDVKAAEAAEAVAEP